MMADTTSPGRLIVQGETRPFLPAYLKLRHDANSAGRAREDAGTLSNCKGDDDSSSPALASDFEPPANTVAALTRCALSHKTIFSQAIDE